MFFKTATQTKNNDIALKLDSDDYGGIFCDNNITLLSRQESLLASDMEKYYSVQTERHIRHMAAKSVMTRLERILVISGSREVSFVD